MVKLTKAVKTMLNALAFADAGEFLSARDKAKQLSKDGAMQVRATPIESSEIKSAAPRQQVGLYMGRELPAYMMDYIIQTCGRMKTGLTVLTFQSLSAAQGLLASYAATLESAGIPLRIEVLNGDPLPGLARYLRRHPDIAFLACSETGYLGRSFLNGAQKTSALPVPVVLVETHRSDIAKIGGTQPKVAAAGRDAG